MCLQVTYDAKLTVIYIRTMQLVLDTIIYPTIKKPTCTFWKTPVSTSQLRYENMIQFLFSRQQLSICRNKTLGNLPLTFRTC